VLGSSPSSGIMCLPFNHKYKVISSREMEDISFGEPGILRTDILYSCSKCHKRKVKSVRGWWTLEELK
jgi:hypothetical protein